MKKWGTILVCFCLVALLAACGSRVSKEEAYNIALKDAGVSADDVTLTKETKDEGEFGFEFHTDTQSFRYEVDEDGTIEKSSVTQYQAPDTKQNGTTDDDTTSGTTTGGADAQTAQTTTPLTQEQALEQAYTHFQVSKDDVTNLQVKKEQEDGQEVYDIEFDVGTKEYSCDISVQTGEVLAHDVDEH